MLLYCDLPDNFITKSHYCYNEFTKTTGMEGVYDLWDYGESYKETYWE